MKSHRTTLAPAGGQTDRILAVVGAARDVPNGVRYDLEIANRDERVPAIFIVPHAHEPVPATLLLHGFGSRKERMIDTVGEALVRQGVAALAIDLPMHGQRNRAASSLQAANPRNLIGTWSDAVAEARLALQYLTTQVAIDSARLGIVGYSLGSFLANVVAADAANVRAIVLAASGDLPEGLPFESLVRVVMDPLRAIRGAAGRPLLMINGRFDRTVRPSQAERLFAAAQEPKTMRWYGGGHWPPSAEIDYAAGWIAERLSPPSARTARTTARRA
jgi:uncharacterized protein